MCAAAFIRSSQRVIRRGRSKIITYAVDAKTAKIFQTAILIFFVFLSPLRAAIDLDQLSSEDAKKVDAILQKLNPLIQQKKSEGTLPILSYLELYSPLNGEEKLFLETMQAIRPPEIGVKTPHLETPDKVPELVRLDKQSIQKNGKQVYLESQYLPRDVHDQYGGMMEAMEKELGKRLYVESGYRAPAYQLYLFIFYLVQHRYSIRETARLNALPGYSEHGCPWRQAIDFISQNGISGEENAESFEVLEEYRWLMKHAHEYHFYLSYPRVNLWGIAFEPWHWHYEREKKDA